MEEINCDYGKGTLIICKAMFDGVSPSVLAGLGGLDSSCCTCLSKFEPAYYSKLLKCFKYNEAILSKYPNKVLD